jgi:putative ABC transport system ATP-binding protein
MAAADSKIYISVQDLTKTFTVKDGDVQILKGLNVNIKKGEFVIIFGPSGCGKSTFLHTLLGLEYPTSGKVVVDDKDYYTWDEDERAMYRRYHYGIIYQQPLWISSLSVRDNVAFPLHLTNYDESVMHGKVDEILALVGMEHWADYRPNELSSGQQQKISLARSLSLDPLLIVADEPTGNLDTVSGQELIDTFRKLNENGRTIIMVTHDLEYLKYGTHLIHMVDGKIVEDVVSGRGKGVGDIKGKRGVVTTTSDANVRDPEFLKKMK